MYLTTPYRTHLINLRWNAKLASTNLWSDYRPDGEGNTPTFFKVHQFILDLMCENFVPGVLSVFSCSNWNCGGGQSVGVHLN